MVTELAIKIGRLAVSLRIGKEYKSKWPSYCRMCMRRDGKDPYKEEQCPKLDCEHFPFKGKYTPPPGKE